MSQSRSVRSTVIGLCLAGLCLTALLMFGLAANASASLFFTPLSGKFPYHLVGSGGKTLLETTAGSQVKSEKVDVLALVLSATLFDLRLEFLKTTGELGSKCSNTSNAETVLVNLLGHFGTADPAEQAVVLLLVPSGFEFTCGGLTKVKVKGAVIGAITKPAENEEAEELALLFRQTKGKQEFTSFLSESGLLANQLEETSISGGAFEQSGQESESITLKALSGEGKFGLARSTVFRMMVNKVEGLGTITIENKIKLKSKVKAILNNEFPVGLNEWKIEEPARANCIKQYEPAGMLGSTCSFKVEYQKKGNVSSIGTLVEDEKQGRIVETLGCTPETC